MRLSSVRVIVLGGVLLSHLLLVVWLLALRPGLLESRMVRSPDDVMFVMIRPPPPPPPPPEAAKEPAPAPKPAAKVVAAPPREIRPAAERPGNAPPVHELGIGGDWGSMDSVSAGAPNRAHRAPTDYAERVKARVVAKLERPAGTVYQVAGKAGASPVFRECTIPYEITVDQQGNMIGYKMEPCGDKALDAAAETALQRSGPFPPPPNAGATSYIIYGSANFKAPQ